MRKPVISAPPRRRFAELSTWPSNDIWSTSNPGRRPALPRSLLPAAIFRAPRAMSLGRFRWALPLPTTKDVWQRRSWPRPGAIPRRRPSPPRPWLRRSRVAIWTVRDVFGPSWSPCQCGWDRVRGPHGFWSNLALKLTSRGHLEELRVRAGVRQLALPVNDEGDFVVPPSDVRLALSFSGCSDLRGEIHLDPAIVFAGWQGR